MSRDDGTEIYFYPDADGSIGSIGYNGNRYYYVRNAQNDIIGITDKTGAFVARYTYDEWGNITSITDGNGNDVSNNPNHIANLNPLRYRSYFYDAETGWYWLNTRYYDPEIGRFINADGYASTGQGMLGHNMFAYCGNNPVNRIDSTGQGWLVALIVATIVTVCTTVSLTSCSSKNNTEQPALEPYSNQANCYAYAMKLENDPRTGRPFKNKPQPGEFSGNKLTLADMLGSSITVKRKINEKVLEDAKVLKLNYTEVYSAYHVPKEGNWLVALAYDSESLDYHWWRKNDDGTWSHKPGSTPVIYWDASGKTITDPGSCNRGIYDKFLGYYEVGPN